VQGDARHRPLAARAQQVDVVAMGDQRLQEARGGALDAVVKDERP
jgi:hypothetical protein